MLGHEIIELLEVSDLQDYINDVLDAVGSAEDDYDTDVDIEDIKNVLSKLGIDVDIDVEDSDYPDRSDPLKKGQFDNDINATEDDFDEYDDDIESDIEDVIDEAAIATFPKGGQRILNDIKNATLGEEDDMFDPENPDKGLSEKDIKEINDFHKKSNIEVDVVDTTDGIEEVEEDAIYDAIMAMPDDQRKAFLDRLITLPNTENTENEVMYDPAALKNLDYVPQDIQSKGVHGKSGNALAKLIGGFKI